MLFCCALCAQKILFKPHNWPTKTNIVHYSRWLSVSLQDWLVAHGDVVEEAPWKCSQEWSWKNFWFHFFQISRQNRTLVIIIIICVLIGDSIGCKRERERERSRAKSWFKCMNSTLNHIWLKWNHDYSIKVMQPIEIYPHKLHFLLYLWLLGTRFDLNTINFIEKSS